MAEIKKNHSKWLHIRLTEDEYSIIHKKYQSSTCRKLSEYARRVLLDKTITVYVRNQSLDDFMTEMIRLRNDLNSIGSNINGAVKKLYILQKTDELKSWLMLFETTRKIWLEKTENIKQKIAQISDLWLQ